MFASGINNLITGAQGVVDMLIPLAFSCALLFFFYGTAKYIFRLGGDVNAGEEAKKIMFWGVIALFVIASIWGIVQFVRSEFDISNTDTITKQQP